MPYTLSPYRRLARLLIPLILGLALSGCLEKTFAPGTVAEVDGQSISFNELEAMRATLFAGQSPATPAHDDAIMHRQYRYALWRLIEERLVCRFMEKKGLTLEEGLLESEEARIRADYPEGAFEQTLTERGILLEDWRLALRRALTMEEFLKQVLRPQISISQDEAQKYFTAHSKQFLIPEQWHFLRVSSQDQQALDGAVKRLLAGEDPELVNKDLPVTIHDVHMAVDLLPEAIRKALAPLFPVSASKSVREGSELSALVLLEKIPSSMLELAEISNRVERVLSEEKMRAIYSTWLEKQLPKAKIRIAPPLAGDYMAPGERTAGGQTAADGSASATADESAAPDAEERTARAGSESAATPEAGNAVMPDGNRTKPAQ